MQSYRNVRLEDLNVLELVVNCKFRNFLILRLILIDMKINFSGEDSLKEYTEVKTITMKLP